nr:transposase IS3/IS911 family protein [Streptomyces sp. XY152]
MQWPCTSPCPGRPTRVSPPTWAERRGVAHEAARAGKAAPARAGQPVPSAGPDERIRQLEAPVAELEASERKLATERDILRKETKYFAGETNW